jgi:hypothetical protein
MQSGGFLTFLISGVEWAVTGEVRTWVPEGEVIR